MSKGDNSPGAVRLARAFRRVAEHGKNNSLLLDFGEIQKDGSLITNTFPIPIPKADYLVCRCDTTYTAGTRVLVAWVGNDAVVISAIVEASEVI